MSNPSQASQYLTEKEILKDCLDSQKHISANYNTFAGECANEQLRSAKKGGCAGCPKPISLRI